MKRLIKKAQMYGGFNKEQNSNEIFDYKNTKDTFYVYINPDSSEIQQVKDISRNGHSVRGVIYSDGTWFIWPGDKALHEDINSVIESGVSKIDINQFRFAYYDNSPWFIDAHGESGSKTRKLVREYRDKLSKIGSLSLCFDIYDSKEYKGGSVKFDVLQPTSKDEEDIKNDVEVNDKLNKEQNLILMKENVMETISSDIFSFIDIMFPENTSKNDIKENEVFKINLDQLWERKLYKKYETNELTINDILLPKCKKAWTEIIGDNNITN